MDDPERGGRASEPARASDASGLEECGPTPPDQHYNSEENGNWDLEYQGKLSTGCEEHRPPVKSTLKPFQKPVRVASPVPLKSRTVSLTARGLIVSEASDDESVG